MARILLVLLSILVTIPLVLSFFPSWAGPELAGVSEVKLSFPSPHAVSSHLWQQEAENYVRRHVGCANNWVRLHNEIEFALFRHTRAEKLVLGKNNCFYEEMYITEVLGRNFVGDDLIRQRVKCLSDLQKLLDQRYGVKLLVVFEPGKAHFSPENIPSRFRPNEKGRTNHQGFTEACQSEGVAFLDLNTLFSERKSASPHPLYSQYGVHWSSYGLWVAADTLARFVSQECGTPLPTVRWKGGTTSDADKDLDFDMEPSMNLLFPLRHERLFFPDCYFSEDSSRCAKPRALTIADSYYWSIWNSGIAAALFSENLFWYYNKAVYPHIWEDVVYADKTKLKETLLEQDVVLLMMTDANLYDFGWGFVEEALAALDPSYTFPDDYAMAAWILHDKEWYQELLKKSLRKQIPFSVVLSETVSAEIEKSRERKEGTPNK